MGKMLLKVNLKIFLRRDEECCVKEGLISLGLFVCVEFSVLLCFFILFGFFFKVVRMIIL